MHFAGSYTEAEGFQGLHKRLSEWEENSFSGRPIGRLYYLALPPSAYSSVVEGLKLSCDLKDPPPKCVLSTDCSLWLLSVLRASLDPNINQARCISAGHVMHSAALLWRCLHQRPRTQSRLAGLGEPVVRVAAYTVPYGRGKGAYR